MKKRTGKRMYGQIVRPIFKGEDCASSYFYFLGETQHLMLLNPAIYDVKNDCFYVSDIIEGYSTRAISCLLWHNKGARIKRENGEKVND